METKLELPKDWDKMTVEDRIQWLRKEIIEAPCEVKSLNQKNSTKPNSQPN